MEPTVEELRRWSAEKVMGWRRLPASGAMNQDFYEDRHEQFKGWAEEGYEKENLWLPDRPESGQIWLLVERMRELGFFWNLVLEDENGTCRAWFGKSDDESGYGIDTNPCKAFLKAMWAALNKETLC